jgi:DNA-binding transcriptional LysR family regulator
LTIAQTGATLPQRVGRGVRLTPTGQLLAERATKIIGRVAAAAAELSTHVGLRAGKVRLAGFSSALSTLVPAAAAALTGTHPGLELNLIDTHPPDALRLLRAGTVDVAVIFRYDESPAERDGIRLLHLLALVAALSTRRSRRKAAYRVLRLIWWTRRQPPGSGDDSAGPVLPPGRPRRR